MGLGDKAAALALAERAMALNPIKKDAVDGPVPIEILARVAARMGEPDRAIAALQKLLSIPYQGALAANVPLTPALLRLDPMFDPLRTIRASRNSARKSSREHTQVFAELISSTSAARFSSQLLCLHLSGAILTRSNARFRDDVIDGCRDVLAETSRK